MIACHQIMEGARDVPILKKQKGKKALPNVSKAESINDLDMFMLK